MRLSLWTGQRVPLSPRGGSCKSLIHAYRRFFIKIIHFHFTLFAHQVVCGLGGWHLQLQKDGHLGSVPGHLPVLCVSEQLFSVRILL